MNKVTIILLLCLLLVSQIFALFYLETFTGKIDANISPPNNNSVSTLNNPSNIAGTKDILNNLAIQTIPDGNSVKCSIGGKDVNAVYRVDDGKLRWYPNPTIASSWNKDWGNITTIPDCSKIPVGSDMAVKK